MQSDPCKATVSDHVLDIFIGNKKDSFNIEDINKINAIETMEKSHTGKIMGAMFGTGVQVATGDFFGIWQAIGTGIGGLYDEFFGDKETIKYLDVFPIKGSKVKYALNPNTNLKNLNSSFLNSQKKTIQELIDEDFKKIDKPKISDNFFQKIKKDTFPIPN